MSSSRPPSNAPSARDIAREWLAKGLTITAAAAKAGICRQTLHDWMQADDSLRLARDIGRAKLETVVLAGAMGDHEFAMKVLAVRAPKAWGRKDRIEQRHSGQIAGSDVDAETYKRLLQAALREASEGDGDD